MPQRTPLQAYKIILSALNSGRVDPEAMGRTCQYSMKVGDREIMCGVGVLFSPAQIADIRARGLNTVDISTVAYRIGEKNITEVTGLQMNDLVNLQSVHDDSATSRDGFGFRQYIQYCIRKLS